ncbi:hypothetical protein J2T57_000453 [Natronocella acetinitrilica]|jgi:hypothetical protein|uniref:DUF4124 domain-containing protein n=1 Tax=Natronocella acetinitrilica TaxID=414046 RepID=A0AAE3G267_9GAMM|nr:DUF4124 domain-containing protein [Natronocella acetinitrilica]MCP1673361.1 hypothetical protein [Natronocella acetinitrilica]
MERRYLPLLLLLLPALSLSQVYRHVDEQGNVSFSDQPRPGAEEIQLDTLPTYQPRTPPRRQQQSAQQAESASERYRTVAIASPGHDDVVRDNQGLVTVRVESEPSLHDGHRYRLLLNGDAVAAGRQASFQLEGIHRGEYSLQVEIINRSDDVVARSESSTFYMLQASRLSPAR